MATSSFGVFAVLAVQGAVFLQSMFAKSATMIALVFAIVRLATFPVAFALAAGFLWASCGNVVPRLWLPITVFAILDELKPFFGNGPQSN